MKFSQFVGAAYAAQAYTADTEQAINVYVEAVGGEGANATRALLGRPGLPTYASTSLSPIRAQYAINGRAFAVIGFAFFEVTDNGDGTGTLTNRGTVDNDGLPATIAGGGDASNQLQIVAGGTLYNYALGTDTLTTVASGGTGNIQGDYLDGYFLKIDSTSTLGISDVLDNTTYDPLQIAQRNDAPDAWSALKVVGKYIILPGSQTTSAAYDAGSFPFPFQLVPGVLINQGIAAPFSLVDLNGAAAWIARSKAGSPCQIVRMVPQQWSLDPISTAAVEYALARYETVDDAVGLTFEHQGHWFYHLNFPTANDSWTFDASTGQWTQWLYWNQATAAWEAWRGQYACAEFGLTLIGDRATGTIYRLDGTTYTDAGGTPLRLSRRCPLPRLLDVDAYVTCQSLHIVMDVGVGLDGLGQGTDPQAMIRISRDAGKTWGNERWTSIGPIGQFATRVMWNRCGRWRDGRGVLELVVSDPVPVRIVDCQFTAKQGAA